MQDLKIGLIQFDIIWQNPAANRALLTTQIESLSTRLDLIILPEMFTTGFTMEVDTNYEEPEGATWHWMKQMAATSNAVITGSIIIKKGQHYFNRLLWVTPNGETLHYDKRHLFRMADEHHYFAQGNEQPIFELNGWKIKPQICYDLRFPAWSRNTNVEYDLVFYVANWPQARTNAWDALLKARAIENLSYCIGVNRVGLDGTNKAYNGHSVCYDFIGKALNNIIETSSIHQHTLSKSKLDQYRKSFPAHLDADSFNIDNIP